MKRLVFHVQTLEIKISHRPAAIAKNNVSRTCASTRRCLIRDMDFCSVSFSGGQKVRTSSSSSSNGAGPVTMKLAIWSFRLLRDCTAGGREGDKWYAIHCIFQIYNKVILETSYALCP